MINKMDAKLSWGLGCGLCVSSVCACFTKSLTTSIILTLVVLTALAILDKDDDFFHPSMRPPRTRHISSLKTDIEATAKRKSTPNPYRKTNENSSAQPETNAPQNKGEQTQTFSLLTPVAPIDWTVKGDQFFKNEHTKREEFSRRHDIFHQSSESRLNLMKSMFEELEESNVKRDPFLYNGEEECAPERGREIITRNWAPI